MQPLTAAPRDAFTAAQVTALLVAPDLTVDYGCELLQDAAWVDISADTSAVVVHRDMLANVHGTLTLTVARQLAWGRDKVRPFMVLSSATADIQDARFNLGLFRMTTPDTILGETPQSWAVTGFDELQTLQDCIQDSWSVAAGANVLAAVTAVLTAAGVTAPILLDTTGSAKTLAAAMVWPQTSSDNPTWLKVANDLLAAIGYQGLWTDWDGAFRSGPYTLPEARPSEFTLTVGDLVTGIVGEGRKVTSDVWGVPNAWRFVQNGLSTPPTEGSGRYSPSNPDVGASSQASVGRVVRGPVVYLDAVDQASLVVQGDRIKAAAMRVSEVITIKVSPFPALWHVDRLTYADPGLGATRQVQVRSWSLPLDGSDGDAILESVS